MKILGLVVRVGELIGEELKGKNENLINDTFEREESIQICSMPTRKMGDEDKLISYFSKNEGSLLEVLIM